MYLLTVFLPLFSFLFVSLFGRFFGNKGSAFISVISLFVSSFSSFFIFYEVGYCGNVVAITLADWMCLGLLDIQWGFLFDSLTAIILIVVTFISSLVHIYSVEYIREDPHFIRFISYLSLFTFFMLILVSADNFVLIFVGWEGVGLCSYLLINFWYTRIQANKAAVKAMIVNRVGDFGLCLGILAIFSFFKSLKYDVVFSVVPYFSDKSFIFFNVPVSVMDLICVFLFIGAVGKSAQIGLHTWLPDAIEGPTPVSALIHAATMVTAGVFLLARCSFLFEWSPLALAVVSIFGGMTAFFAASTGLVQNDLKRVIAYSTCSQLGYIVFACGLSAYNVGVFHLANHAFFKALLFLCAGSVIHAISDEQDIRRIGGLVKLMPFTYASMIIGSFALIGFPFLAGFYSKDVILEVSFSSYTIPGHFCFFLGSMGAFFTAFYSIRLIFFSFLSKPTGFKASFESAHDSSFFIGFPLFVLSICSIFAGWFSRDFFLGFGSSFWSNSININFFNLSLIDAEFMPSFFKLIPLVFSFIGGSLSYFLYFYGKGLFFFRFKKTFVGKLFYTFFNRKWLVDRFYFEFINQKVMNFSYFTSYKIIDRGFIEFFGPFGLSNFLYRKAFMISKNQSGLVYHYLLIMLLGIFFMLTVVLFSFSGNSTIFFDFKYIFFFILILFFALGIYVFLFVSVNIID